MPRKSKLPAAPVPTDEPETMTAASVADAPFEEDVRPAKPRPFRTEPSLNNLAEYLADRGRAIEVRMAIAAVYAGEVDAKREFASLNIIKTDDRFVITDAAGKNMVGLAGMSSTETSAPTVDMAPEYKVQAEAVPAAPADPTPTIADHVAAAAASPQHITWPHDIGSSVLLRTEGYADKKATIRRINDHGGYVLYDLNVGEGQTDGVPANRIGRDLDAEGELAHERQHRALLERHIKVGKDLAQKHAEMEAQTLKLSETLSKHKKATDAVATQLAAHMRSEPGQTELGDIIAGPSRGEKMGAEPGDDEDLLAEPGENAPVDPAAGARDGSTIRMEAVGLTVDQVLAARLEQGTSSTGKPQKVKPVTIGNDLHVLTDVQDGLAVMRPIVDAEAWQKRYVDVYGLVLSLPSDAPSEMNARGGKLCGVPVKVGRKTLWLAPETDAVLLTLPPAEPQGDEPAERAVGKEAAAGA